MTFCAVILAGGVGQRLAPLSTKERPKQFLPLFGNKPLITHTADRLEGLVPLMRTFVITAPDYLPLTALALDHLPPANLIGEPESRNTAAAIALACGLIRQRTPEATVAFLPADHWIDDPEAFREALAQAATLAHEDPVLITLGVTPTSPATGYGYIECDAPFPTSPDAISNAEEVAVSPFRKVKRFVEKPTLEKAQTYLAAGSFLWNCGIFIGHLRTWENAFATLAPDYLPLLQHPETAERLYPSLPRLPIDIAIMEKATNLLVLPVTFAWDDLGTPEALARHCPPNVLSGLEV